MDSEENDSPDSLFTRILQCQICSRNRTPERDYTYSNFMDEIELLDNVEMEFLGVLGEGGFGKVFQYRIVEDNSIVAVKQISIVNIFNAVPGSIIREVSYLKGLNHPNIVRLLNVSNKKGTTGTRLVSLVFESLDCDLKKYIVHNEGYGSSMNDPFTRKSFLYQILSAVEYCHSHKIIHRDLKPSNLLVDHSKKIIKLADFGLARELGDIKTFHTKRIGTCGYRAPEILFEYGKYSTSIDIWAVGCIFGEMVLGKPIRKITDCKGELELIFKIFGTPTEETWPGVTKLCTNLQAYPKFNPMDLSTIFYALDPTGLNLLMRMLCLDPNKRISAEAALKHAYFNDLDQSANKKIRMMREGGSSSNNAEEFAMTMKGGSTTTNNNNSEEFAKTREGGSSTTTNNNAQEFAMTMESESSTTININEGEFAAGSFLSIRTVFGEEFEGQVVTFVRPSNTLALMEGSKDDPLRKIRILKADYIKDFTFLGQYEDPLDPHSCYLDLNVLQAREELAIRQAEADAERIGVGVTSVAQNIFDALSKTLPVRWEKTIIVVMNEVRISSPYHSECVIGGTRDANNRVKKVLEMLRKRLKLPSSGDQ